jgi:hypothetical protein
MNVCRKVALCEKIPHEKSYLSVLDVNEDINDISVFIFLTVHGYLMIFGDDYLTVHSLVNMESKCVGISKVSHIVYEIKSFECFFYIFNRAQQQCNDLTWKIQGF